jgi:hypothetical protein
MTSAALEAYLRRLERELRMRGLTDRRIVDEAREHLFDAVEHGLRRGLSADAAEREALVRFGSPEVVAEHFATRRHRMSNWLFSILSRLTRRAGRTPGNAPEAVHFHDVSVPSRYHFALRLKRRYRNRGKDISAFETDPRERLEQFLREFGRRTFGSSETLESVTLLEDTTDSHKRGGRYLAAFAGGNKMIWTIALSGDGAVSFDGTNAPNASNAPA